MTSFSAYVVGASRGTTFSCCAGEHAKVLMGFYEENVTRGGKQMFVDKHPNGEVFYTFCVGGEGRNFTDYHGRCGSFFGMSVVLKDQQFASPQKAYKMLDNIYEESIKGNLIEDNGMYKRYLVDDLGTQAVDDFLGRAFQKEFAKKQLSANDFVAYQGSNGGKISRQVYRVPNPAMMKKANSR